MKTVLLAFALLLFAATAHANVLISSVEVDVGSLVFCNTGNVSGGCATAAHPWNLGAGILLTPGQTLVLTSTAVPFDTSEGCRASDGGCRPPTVTINGTQTFTDTTRILGGVVGGVLDPVTSAYNEAADWQLLGTTPTYALSVGYGDTIHTNPCADASGDCHPNAPFTDATYFLGPLGAQYDTGAVLIRAVPVPATWLLMGLGLLVSGLALRRRAHD